MRSELLTLVVGGFSYLIEILGGVFVFNDQRLKNCPVEEFIYGFADSFFDEFCNFKIITLPVSKLEILEKIKSEFEQILTVQEQKLEFYSNNPETHGYIPFPTKKQYFVFSILLDF